MKHYSTLRVFEKHAICIPNKDKGSGREESLGVVLPPRPLVGVCAAELYLTGFCQWQHLFARHKT